MPSEPLQPPYEAVATPESSDGPPPRHVASLIVPGLVALAVSALLLVSAQSALRPSIEVEVVPVIAGEQAISRQVPARGEEPRRRTRVFQAPGWLEADPFYVACAALADGVVESVLVLEGERVEKGQIVAKLIAEDASLDLSRATGEVNRARADLAAAQADLHAATTDWEHPVQRERAVQTSRAALAEAEAELEQLPSLIARERAMAERMEEELARSMEALQSGAATSIEIIILEKNLAGQRATLAATERRQPILDARRDRLEAELTAAQRDADLRITERQALERARASMSRAQALVATAEAREAEAQLRLERMTVRAPISGFVQRRLKVPGDKVMQTMDDPLSAQVVHLYDPSSLQVRVDVPLADAANVFLGQQCQVIVEVLPDVTFDGTVTRITHEADLQKNTLQVKVRVIDPSPLLKPEMLTRVKFLSESAEDADHSGAAFAPAHESDVLVPAVSLAALEERKGVVWAIRARRGDTGVAERIGVELIGIEDEWAQIRGAVRASDLLVVQPARLKRGSRVVFTAARQESGGVR